MPTDRNNRNNIIHVNFFGPHRKPPVREPWDGKSGVGEAELAAVLSSVRPSKPERRASFIRLSAPWIVRIMAVVAILVLSFLVL
jgi:hypothetical protein